MVRLIKEYIKMKKNEFKCKCLFYGFVGELIDNNKEITSFIQRLYEELKDVPDEELRKEFISKFSELIHAQAVKERETVNKEK